MKNGTAMKQWIAAISLMILGGGMSANSMGDVGDFTKMMAKRAVEPRHASWKEEVQLHDGRKLIVERSQSYGGRHEIGQSPPVKEHALSFQLPGSNKTVKWISEYGEDLGRTNFNVLALHVLAGIPYLITEPNLCLSYNKWGRPNPPYVIFKHEGKAWQRIQLSELPPQFKTINLIINNGREEDIESAARKTGYVSAAGVAELNSSLKQPEYRTILREPLNNAGQDCGEMIYDGKGGWIGLGWFRDQPSREACVQYCTRHGIEPKYCPCDQLFKRGK